MTVPPFFIALALAAINLVTLALFGIDKALARGGYRRVRESTLLWLALIGGTAGAYAGRGLFRHKTRKEPFSSRLFAIAVLQAVALGAAMGWTFLSP
jgi:uncharacterized membrane protein YsdA (DUF1294 family)